MLKPVVYKSLLLVKLSGTVAKLSLLFTAISTVATMLNTIEGEMGWAIDAVCVTTYLICKTFVARGYDVTSHVPPVRRERIYTFTEKN